MSKNVIEVVNLTKYYGKIRGVEDVSLSLQKGEVVGFIGPNGAGKSTTIRSIMNLINKTSGQILIEGKEFLKDDIELKEKIGYLPSEINLYEDLTVKEIFDYHESFYKRNIHKRRMELIQKLQIDEKKKIEDLSLGNLKKVGIVLALMHSPSILILDEATSGLDPIMQNIFYEILLEEKKKNTTILYSTHILNEVKKICDRVELIKEGRIVKIDKMEELLENNLTYVIITSKEINKIVKDLKLKVASWSEDTIKFTNSFTADELIKKLSKYQIEKILIQEASLEEIFLHYYK